MNDQTSPERKDRALALFALAAMETPQTTDCPSEETLAQFIDGQLRADAREAMLAHLNRCHSCYHHWLEVASHLNVAAQAAPTSTQTESGVSVWQRLQIWFGDWKFMVPITATALLLITVILWRPISPELPAELDLAYARLSAEHAARAHTLPPLLPWEGASLGFSESQASAPRRAFGAGLWAGKRALFGADEQTLPEFLSPPDGVTWLKTEWTDYHTLGRWMMLVWALAASDQGVDWNEQAAIGQRLFSELSKGGTGQEVEAQRATAAVERLKPLLAALKSEADPPSRAELRRAVEMAMQQLAP